MFVCTGNICRSPLAEAVFRDLVGIAGLSDRFEIASSGTSAYHVGQPADDRMRRVASAHGVTIRNRSQQLEEGDLDDYDLLLGMDLSNLHEMRALAARPEHRAKLRLFREFDPEGGKGAEVPDPYYGGPAGFERVYAMVERTCRSLLAALRDEVPLREG